MAEQLNELLLHRVEAGKPAREVDGVPAQDPDRQREGEQDALADGRGQIDDQKAQHLAEQGRMRPFLIRGERPEARPRQK